MAAKPDYGIDAPGVIRNLLIAGIGLAVFSLLLPRLAIGSIHLRFFPGFIYSGGACSIGGVLMLAYSKFGKFKHRDRMLAKVPWTGAESVLDVGAGRGLLLSAQPSGSPPATPPASISGTQKISPATGLKLCSPTSHSKALLKKQL